MVGVCGKMLEKKMKPVNRMFHDDSIAEIEKKYNAQYVFDSCLKTVDGDWANYPSAIFYTEKAHPEGSNYFALYKSITGDWMITNGLNAVQGEFLGFLFEDGDLVHSRYRHDYFIHRNVMVDGGRDYFKSSSLDVDGAKRIYFKIEKDQIVEVTK